MSQPVSNGVVSFALIYKPYLGCLIQGLIHLLYRIYIAHGSAR